MDATRDKVLQAIQHDRFYIIPFKFRNDKEVMLAAVRRNGPSLQQASPQLRDDREVVMAAVSEFGGALAYASTRLKNDYDIVVAALLTHNSSLGYASDDLKSNKIIVLPVLKEDPQLWYILPPALQEDPDIVLATLSEHSASSIDYICIPPSLFKNRDFIIKLVSQNGMSLRHLSPELKDDKEIVLEAIHNTAGAFMCASINMRSNWDVAMAACVRNIYLIDYVCEPLWSDKTFILKLIECCHDETNCLTIWSELASFDLDIYQAIMLRYKNINDPRTKQVYTNILLHSIPYELVCDPRAFVWAIDVMGISPCLETFDPSLLKNPNVIKQIVTMDHSFPGPDWFMKKLGVWRALITGPLSPSILDIILGLL